MKKYEKVLREDYEAWYRDNRDYRERVRADESRLAYHLMPERPQWALPVSGTVPYLLSVYTL